MGCIQKNDRYTSYTPHKGDIYMEDSHRDAWGIHTKGTGAIHTYTRRWHIQKVAIYTTRKEHSHEKIYPRRGHTHGEGILKACTMQTRSKSSLYNINSSSSQIASWTPRGSVWRSFQCIFFYLTYSLHLWKYGILSAKHHLRPSSLGFQKVVRFDFLMAKVIRRCFVERGPTCHFEQSHRTSLIRSCNSASRRISTIDPSHHHRFWVSSSAVYPESHSLHFPFFLFALLHPVASLAGTSASSFPYPYEQVSNGGGLGYPWLLGPLWASWFSA